MKVAFFGGSFNPPHIGHVLAVAYVLSTQDVEQLLVVPCFLHPLGKRLAGFQHRLAMSEAAMGWLARTEVSAVEQELGGASRTLRTIEHLMHVRPGDTFHLVMGADLLLEASRWHGFERVMALAPPIVLGRAGVQAAGAPPAVLPEVSSSMIRDALSESRFDCARPFLPRSVWDYIEEHRLYREPDRSSRPDGCHHHGSGSSRSHSTGDEARDGRVGDSGATDTVDPKRGPSQRR